MLDPSTPDVTGANGSSRPARSLQSNLPARFDLSGPPRSPSRWPSACSFSSCRSNRRRHMMTVKFVPNDRGNPPGKLSDAELHFSGGPIDGLKLVGFSVWERKGGGRNVTFPARQYSVNGERRSFSLLRPIVDAKSQDRLRDVILDAYREHEAAMAEAS